MWIVPLTSVQSFGWLSYKVWSQVLLKQNALSSKHFYTIELPASLQWDDSPEKRLLTWVRVYRVMPKICCLSLFLCYVFHSNISDCRVTSPSRQACETKNWCLSGIGKGRRGSPNHSGETSATPVQSYRALASLECRAHVSSLLKLPVLWSRGTVVWKG